MSPCQLALQGAILCALSGLIPYFPGWRAAGQRLATLMLAGGALCGLVGAVITLIAGRIDTLTLDWDIPFGPATLATDPLTAVFLLLIFTIAACCSVYSLGYWSAERRGLSLFFGILVAALVLVVLSRTTIIFLMAWEVMALANYLLLTAESDSPAVCSAGRTYLIATHLGTLAIFALFALLQNATGSFLFPPDGSLAVSAVAGLAMFVTALVGFGMKAGLMPFHVWLPAAHANAPSQISAIMSGVVIKMGIYGLLRTFGFFAAIPPWWGVTILIAGIISGIGGVLFAIAQHDIKRLLAYHSIENIGIIAMGIGMALMGRAHGVPALVALGLGGALLHVLNHGLFKSLLFLGAGSVLHAMGSRDIDRMGGLARAMPWTALFFLTGAVAICGLPPLNGFVSEFLIYLGLLDVARRGTMPATPLLALAIPALALIGGLATACFVKVFGAAFLGSPRSEAAAHGHEAGPAMLAPMGFLALCCLVIGLWPAGICRLLDPALRTWLPVALPADNALSALAPLGTLSVLGILILGLVAGVGLLFRALDRGNGSRKGLTWDCGYAAPAPSMQYTSSSFAAILVQLFAGLLRPDSHRPSLRELFPRQATFASHVPEVILERLIIPLFNGIDRRLAVVRRLQHGQLHFYILYIAITLVALLAWARQGG